MGKKTTTLGPSSSGTSKRTKTVAPTTTANVPQILAQVARGNQPPPPHAINKYALQFVDQEQTNRYDSIAS